ncbi:MAG: metalloregulator ArsR/SmtB family transcription factor [Nitrospirae bacterium]|nr:metalloregulator ArsR/SmtB family transcription factor [Nitrospirota bacterium]
MTKREDINSTEQLSRFLKVLGDTNRLGIALSIGKESRSVTEIVNASGLSQTLISFHLRIMREAYVVRTKRNGPFIYYSLSDPSLLGLLSELSRMVNGNNLPIEKTPEPTAKRTTKLTARRKR